MTAYDRREAQETVDRIRHALEHPPSEPARRRVTVQPPSPHGRLETELTSLPEYEILKIKRAVQSGDIRRDLDPFDLLRALIGVSNVASTPDWPESARRLVDILISGSRPKN